MPGEVLTVAKVQSLGAGYLIGGAILGLPLYGITVSQGIYYFRTYRGDRSYLKILVGSLMALESIHMIALLFYIHEFFLGVSFTHGESEIKSKSNNDESFSVDNPSGLLISEIAATTLILLVQCGYAKRIWTVSFKNKLYTVPIVTTSVFQADTVSADGFQSHL
ncbi:hypothetical protein HGRIS_004101 [Hohenbuehelia grisea]|uniref:Uncharacterized protein n=1 Tax=Hohenbuehelia grisea TaxID=104357 RepID=A0ABR3JJ81_9AGAR